MMISKNPLPQNTPEILKAKFNATIDKVIREAYPAGKYRSRKLDFATLTKLLITMDGGSLAKELHSAGLDVSASAFVQRRKQLECRHFERILEEFNDICEDTATFNGYRVFAVDGTSVNLARDPSADTFMFNSSTPKGYNQLHVTPLYDVLNKTYHDCCLQPQPKQDEIGSLRSMLLFNFTVPRPSIIVGDRGFESYNLFVHLQKVEGMEFIIRVKQEKSAMKLIRDLPMQELDVDVSGEITTQQTNEDKEKGRIFIQTHANPNREYSDNTVHHFCLVCTNEIPQFPENLLIDIPM